MNIIYTDKHNYNKNELEELFLSVGWSSGAYSGSSDHAFRYELIRLSGCN